MYTQTLLEGSVIGLASYFVVEHPENTISFGEERETNKMQLIRCLLSNFYLNMFRASLCPSSGEQDRVLPHMVFCTDCAGCGCVELMGIMMPETC